MFMHLFILYLSMWVFIFPPCFCFCLINIQILNHFAYLKNIPVGNNRLSHFKYTIKVAHIWNDFYIYFNWRKGFYFFHNVFVRLGIKIMQVSSNKLKQYIFINCRRAFDRMKCFFLKFLKNSPWNYLFLN